MVFQSRRNYKQDELVKTCDGYHSGWKKLQVWMMVQLELRRLLNFFDSFPLTIARATPTIAMHSPNLKLNPCCEGIDGPSINYSHGGCHSTAQITVDIETYT